MNAVQGTIKIIDVDEDGRPLPQSMLPQHLQKEITMYYYLGDSQLFLESKTRGYFF